MYHNSFTTELARIRSKPGAHFSTREIGEEIEFGVPANDPFGRAALRDLIDGTATFAACESCGWPCALDEHLCDDCYASDALAAEVAITPRCESCGDLLGPTEPRFCTDCTGD
jgi:hypothetical protein